MILDPGMAQSGPSCTDRGRYPDIAWIRIKFGPRTFSIAILLIACAAYIATRSLMLPILEVVFLLSFAWLGFGFSTV